MIQDLRFPGVVGTDQNGEDTDGESVTTIIPSNCHGLTPKLVLRWCWYQLQMTIYHVLCIIYYHLRHVDLSQEGLDL